MKRNEKEKEKEKKEKETKKARVRSVPIGSDNKCFKCKERHI